MASRLGIERSIHLSYGGVQLYATPSSNVAQVVPPAGLEPAGVGLEGRCRVHSGGGGAGAGGAAVGTRTPRHGLERPVAWASWRSAAWRRRGEGRGSVSPAQSACPGLHVVAGVRVERTCEGYEPTDRPLVDPASETSVARSRRLGGGPLRACTRWCPTGDSNPADPPCERGASTLPARRATVEWRMRDSNSRPAECHPAALPAELIPRGVELRRLELRPPACETGALPVELQPRDAPCRSRTCLRPACRAGASPIGQGRVSARKCA